MRWTVRSERALYRDRWVNLRSADIELPDGRHLDHRLIRTAPSAGAVIVLDGRALLLWRHRFITDSWGYEIPIGKVDPGEDLLTAAARETEEETGWRPGPLLPLINTHPTPGLMNSEHHVFITDSATHIGEPADAYESERVEWVPLADVQRLIDKRDIVSGTTLVALLYLLASKGSRGG
jgi:8-oxo-dGTP pyrophosphatase MutT (NUDIX family)